MIPAYTSAIKQRIRVKNIDKYVRREDMLESNMAELYSQIEG